VKKSVAVWLIDWFSFSEAIEAWASMKRLTPMDGSDEPAPRTETDD
jgi:hypothetical protein